MRGAGITYTRKPLDDVETVPLRAQEGISNATFLVARRRNDENAIIWIGDDAGFGRWLSHFGQNERVEAIVEYSEKAKTNDES